MKYEESFTAYLDFLGFSEASKDLDDSDRQKVLDLLVNLVALRSEFRAAISDKNEGSGTSIFVAPAISTFSDHIVISYGLDSLRENTKMDERNIALLLLSQIQHLASAIAAAALRIGFLIRGAATFGKLYHAHGVVFGEALVEAYQLESRTAVYPRIVLSSSPSRRAEWTGFGTVKDDDGIYCVDYIGGMLFRAAQPGDDWATNVKQWFDEIVVVVQSHLEKLGRADKLSKVDVVCETTPRRD